MGVAPIFLVTAVAAVFAVKSITPILPTGKGNSSGNVAGAFGCLGGSGLLFALVGAACLSDFRTWYATRTVKLVIYQKASPTRAKGHRESCSWGDIQDINCKLIEVKSKHSVPRRVSVMRSIVKRDGTVISFAETLNLKKITSLITEQRKGLVA